MRTLVVGAGITGLVAARELVAAGHEVLVLDKGRSPGGRLATRRIDGATLDHGAQFFTVRGEDMARLTDECRRDGAVTEWCRGFGTPDGHPRYIGTGGMASLAKHLATGLDVRCNTFAFAIRPAGSRWEVAIDDGSSLHGDAVVLSCPLPQAMSFLVTAEVEMRPDLTALEFERVLALLVVLDGPSGVPEPGGVQPDDGVFGFVADNQQKGISAEPALTLHARADWSVARWDRDRAGVHAELLAAATPWLGGARVVTSQVKRWRMARPAVTPDEPFWAPAGAVAPLIVAGDAFGGPSIEGAVRSALDGVRSILT